MATALFATIGVMAMMMGIFGLVLFFLSVEAMQDRIGVLEVREQNLRTKIEVMEARNERSGVQGSDLQSEIKTNDPIGDPSEGVD